MYLCVPSDANALEINYLEHEACPRSFFVFGVLSQLICVFEELVRFVPSFHNALLHFPA